MSEGTINYLVYDTQSDAILRADSEGSRRQYPYFIQPNGVTRYHTYPKLTSNGKYALDVTEYELTEDEESAITNSVTFPEPEEI
jgi:hypothetical protein